MEKFILHPSGPVALATLLVEMLQLLSTSLHLYAHIIRQVVWNPWKGVHTHKPHWEGGGGVGRGLLLGPGESPGDPVRCAVDALKYAIKSNHFAAHQDRQGDHHDHNRNHPTNYFLQPPWEPGPNFFKLRLRLVENGRHSGSDQDGGVGPHIAVNSKRL